MANNKIEFLLGGLATCGAGFFTNPLEVVKTRMQLQGELKARGMYTVHYRGVLHAIVAIARNDGILALQKGLVPALWYQLFMNGVRLGVFQVIVNNELTKDDKTGRPSLFKTVIAGAFAGASGAAFGSPIYMVKTHLQARAAQEIAVGHQHLHESMTQGLLSIYRLTGIRGLWRGVEAAMSRVMVGSAAQLSTFSFIKQYIENKKIFKKGSLVTALVASSFSGIAVVFFMTPFDVVSTRLYNQGFDPRGRGTTYTGVIDCFSKILRTEGLWGFYKGWVPSFLRVAPHTVLSLIFWDETRRVYYKYVEKVEI